MKKIQLVTGTLVSVLFLIHITLMTLLLFGCIPYSPYYKYTGVILVAFLILHVFISILNIKSNQSHKIPHYIISWISGLVTCLILSVHGRDYVEEINLLFLHFNKGIIAACIETVFLVLMIFHFRINVDTFCDILEIEDSKKRVFYGRMICGLGTLIILVTGTAIWKYFLL